MEEADESLGWLQLIADLDLAGGREQELDWLLRESGELLAIFAASQKTAKSTAAAADEELLVASQRVSTSAPP